MTRKMLALLLLPVMLLLLVGFAVGQKMTAIRKDGIVYIPVRSLSNVASFNCQWNNENKTFYFANNWLRPAKITVNGTVTWRADGKTIKLPKRAFIYKDRLMVPATKELASFLSIHFQVSGSELKVLHENWNQLYALPVHSIK